MILNRQFGRNEDVAVRKKHMHSSSLMIYHFQMIRLRQASQTNDMNTKMAILDQAAT